ncbi:divergent polysaccharide deacetylase family protein [Shewanella salipaludis]
MRYLLLVLLLTGMPHAYAAQLALIIDDIGYRRTDAAVLSLPQNVTLSILPYTPFGDQLAHKAHAKGHEIMLHLPMQALNGNALGMGGLTNLMDEAEIKSQVDKALERIPFAKGVNNHMGSLLTQLQLPMHWVMQRLKQHELYFVDSVTTHFSQAGKQARREGVPLLERGIFLDNDLTPKVLEKQFRQAIAQAKTQGSLVVIAHPHPETVLFLKENLRRLAAQGVTLVPTSALLGQGTQRLAKAQLKSNQSTSR